MTIDAKLLEQPDVQAMIGGALYTAGDNIMADHVDHFDGTNPAEVDGCKARSEAVRATAHQFARDLPALLRDAERWRFVLEAATREPVRVGNRIFGEPWVYGVLWQAPRALTAEDINAMVDLARQQDTPGATSWEGVRPATPAPQGNRSSVPEVSTNEKAPEAGAATDTV